MFGLNFLGLGGSRFGNDNDGNFDPIQSASVRSASGTSSKSYKTMAIVCGALLAAAVILLIIIVLLNYFEIVNLPKTSDSPSDPDPVTTPFRQFSRPKSRII